MRTSPLAAVLLLSLLVSTGCALRPRYAEVVPANAADGDVAWLQIVDASTGEPLPDVQVIVGEGRQRVRQRTDPQGVFTLPVSTAWQRANPIIEVVPPRGVSRYEIRPAKAPGESPEPSAPQPAPVPQAPESPAEPVPQPAAQPRTEPVLVPETAPAPESGSEPGTDPAPESEDESGAPAADGGTPESAPTPGEQAP